jgi:hypothetical protein
MLTNQRISTGHPSGGTGSPAVEILKMKAMKMLKELEERFPINR